MTKAQATFYGMLLPLEKNLSKLLEKVYESGKRALVLIDTQERLVTLNSALWSYATMSFIPHGYQDVHGPWAKDQPIWLSCTMDNPNGSKVFVNTCGMDYTMNIDPFERIMDLFDASDPKHVQKAKVRQAQLQTHMAVSYWQQTEKSTWEKGTL